MNFDAIGQKMELQPSMLFKYITFKRNKYWLRYGQEFVRREKNQCENCNTLVRKRRGQNFQNVQCWDSFYVSIKCSSC